MGKIKDHSCSHDGNTLAITKKDANNEGGHNYSGTLTDIKNKKYRFKWSYSDNNGLVRLSGLEKLFDHTLFSQAVVSTEDD